jgi:hypothetical protein
MDSSSAHVIDVRVVRARDFLKTTVAGTLDFERSRALLREALTQHPPADGFDLLLDLRKSTDTMSYKQIHLLIQEIKAAAPDFAQRVAVLENWGSDLEKAQFFEADARHEGYDVRAFHRFETALDWLFEARD